jgi:hypothetical protein
MDSFRTCCDEIFKSQDRIRELSSIVENQPGTDFISKDNHDPRNSKTQASYGSTVVSASNLLN